MSQYKFYQGLNFQAVFTTGKPTKTVFQVENSYLPDFPRGLNAAPDTKSVFCKNVHLSQVDLSAETWAQTPNTQHTVWIFRNTRTAHITRKTTHLHTERSEGMTAFNPLCAAIRPKCDSSPLFLFIFNVFYSPLHSHCDSKGRAYLKLTPAPWYPFENTDQILQLAWDGLRDVVNIQNERDGNAKQQHRAASSRQETPRFQGCRSIFFFLTRFPSSHLYHLPL